MTSQTQRERNTHAGPASLRTALREGSQAAEGPLQREANPTVHQAQWWLQVAFKEHLLHARHCAKLSALKIHATNL